MSAQRAGDGASPAARNGGTAPGSRNLREVSGERR